MSEKPAEGESEFREPVGLVRWVERDGRRVLQQAIKVYRGTGSVVWPETGRVRWEDVPLDSEEPWGEEDADEKDTK